MSKLEDCQIPCLEQISEGRAEIKGRQPLLLVVKRRLAYPWNALVKPVLKRAVRRWDRLRGHAAPATVTLAVAWHPGDRVRVRSRPEIEATLDRFHELKGCAFLPGMWQFCGSEQRVLVAMERFVDERDYKVKKTHGLVLLDGVLCEGTPAFGRCDRRCHLFWREEWLEKLEA
jgi:hypothetical protein